MSLDSAFDLAQTFPNVAYQPPLLRRSTRRGTLVSHERNSPRRPHLEEFVRRAFAKHFDARIKHFMPELLALHAADGSVRSVVGCRAAASEPLFLETYTREPIEDALARRNGFFVPREQIVEIGSLACSHARAAVEIVNALVPHLLDAGYTWVVFTGADTVMNVFRHLGLMPQPLCAADAALLGDARHDWGTYYAHEPQVMAGRIRDGMRSAHILPNGRVQ